MNISAVSLGTLPPPHCFLNTPMTELQQQQQPFNGRLSGTTRVGWYQKKHSPAHTHPGQRTSFITFEILKYTYILIHHNITMHQAILFYWEKISNNCGNY